MSAVPAVVALLAPARGRLEVDPVTGEVAEHERGAMLSAADAAALEVALELGEAWGYPVIAVSLGGAGAAVVLREAISVGVSRAVWIQADDHASTWQVADSIATAVESDEVAMVVAGVHGVDLASGAVPGFVAHLLEAEQAFGLIEVNAVTPGVVDAVRRLDGGAREHLRISAPGVISVEGAVARLRRASFGAVLAARAATIEVATPQKANSTGNGHFAAFEPRSFRPRAKVVEPPSGDDALTRIEALTGAGGETSRSRSVELDPGEAAAMILERLGEWGYPAGGPAAP